VIDNPLMTAAILFLIFINLNTLFQAQEAHRHLHEIACEVGAIELCKFHTGEAK